jgi:hypothetical protein
MAGPWFCILGGVFLSRAVVQPLTDFIPLTVNLRAFDQVKRISRLFYSLSLGFQQLGTFYQNLNLSASDQRFFPYVRQYRGADGNNVSFTYLNELSDDQPRVCYITVMKMKQRHLEDIECL